MQEFELRELQLIQIEMLKEFITICKEHKLKYYLIGGTLLGAIRHGGFIPWDDDIDVAMPRNDYEVFISKGQKLLSNKYFIQNYKTDPEFAFNFSKIRNSETTFIETANKNKKQMNHGVYIDIFPLDGYPKSDLEYKRIKILDMLYEIQVNKTFYYKTQTTTLKYKILCFISNLLYGRKSLRDIQDKKEKLFTKYKTEYSQKLASYNGVYKEKEIMPQDYFGNGIQWTFEGIEANIPEKYDLYLKQLYGDYMKLPPEKDRIAHHYNEIVDLKNSYKKYVCEEQ